MCETCSAHQEWRDMLEALRNSLTDIEVGKEYWSSQHKQIVAIVEVKGGWAEVENEYGQRFMARTTKLEEVND